MEKDDIKLIFGLKLKQVRNQKSLSLYELSKITGLSKSYLNEIEKGKKYPKTDKIVLLSEKLEIPYDDLVSLRLDKNLAPVGALLRSKILKEIPLKLFGIKEGDLIDIVANAPTKVNAFISTIIEIAKHYNFGKENFYLAALRSFQEANNNFFPEIELAIENFAKTYHINLKKSVSSKELEQILVNEFGYIINTSDLTKHKELDNLRSVFIPKTKTLLIANHIDEAQRTFIYAKELGYNFLSFEERLYTFTWIKFENFDQVLNNFYASYFAGALVIPRKAFVQDINKFLSKSYFDKTFLGGIKNSYNASPETLYQRLTNILPENYQLNNLFFLRFGHQKGTTNFDLNKELHLTHQHSPHGNETDETYCRRWASIRVLQDITKTEDEHHMDVQISHYPQNGLSYLVFSSATKDPFKLNEYRSISLGILINNQLKEKVKFIDHHKIKTLEVGVTCERCAISDCEVRQAKPKVLLRQKKNAETERVVNDLHKRFG